MLEVNHVSKKYGKTLANDDVCLQAKEGEITIILGPNGAGKSTIIKSIIGFLKYKGSILVDGNYNKSSEAKRIIGYVPEIPALYPNLTVEEHLEFIARAYKLTDYTEYKEELLSRFELTEARGKFGDELSKGMKQKVSICMGLITRPKYILFDEPMIGLDPHAIKELKLIFEEMREAGNSVFISTHMIDSIEQLWDTTYIMKGGKVAARVSRQDEIDSGRSLEERFFEITEGKEV